MDPFKYRKAYEAMMHASQLLEVRLHHDTTESDSIDAAIEEEDATRPSLVREDSDAMEWTPTGVNTPPTGCGPPPSTSQNMRHLLPDGGDGEYRLKDKGPNSVLLHKVEGGTIVDACIDKLVRDLGLNHDNSAAFTPSTIEVPKDFGLQLSISINHHLMQVADQKRLQKYRRLLGHRKEPTKGKFMKPGFDPVELMKKQAITFSEETITRESTLDNDIHPIFRVENFNACSDAVYEVLKPALRLTTLLLFSQATSSFWHTLVFGERKPCPKTSKLYGQPCCRIIEDVAWTQKHAAAFKTLLDNQVDMVHFMFHRNPLPPDPVYASMGLVTDYKNGLLRRLDSKCHTSRICLHSDFYTTAKKLSLLQYPDPAMVLRFNLFLAVTIAHEMAHFIEVSGPHHEHPLNEPEAFFNDNTWAESGIAFELKIFGGRLHPISSRVDCGLGMAVLSYPLKELYDKEDNVLYTLSMDYITKLQQKETWEQDFSNLGADVLHVPRTGCKSNEVNGTNLMVWEDENNADISDHIDGKDTALYRLDDGQIVKNPNSSNRKPRSENRRFNPYARALKRSDSEVVSQTSKSGIGVDDPDDKGQEDRTKEDNEVADGADGDAEML